MLGFTMYNPKLALIIALFVNVIEIVLMAFSSINVLNIFLFVIAVSLTKVFPIWTLKKTTIKFNHIYPLLILFAIYIIWLNANNVDLINEYFNTIEKIKKNEPIGPFMYYVNKYIVKQ
jgi:hypothetical protein